MLKIDRLYLVHNVTLQSPIVEQAKASPHMCVLLNSRLSPYQTLLAPFAEYKLFTKWVYLAEPLWGGSLLPAYDVDLIPLQA